ncbi:acyl-CoA N-acyltransferase, partial [Saccharata proteae CBS 121410]
PPSFVLQKLPTLAANISLEPVTRATLPSFRRLNSLLLPIPYPAKFYEEILTDAVASSITLVALWNDADQISRSDQPAGVPSLKSTLVAGIRCRLLPASSVPEINPGKLPSGDTRPVLYIATLAALSPYRSHGLATHLLRQVLRKAVTDHGVGAVTAHVWEANEEGLEWYRKRGFEVVAKEEGYYRRLSPSGAWLVRKRIRVEDLLDTET